MTPGSWPDHSSCATSLGFALLAIGWLVTSAMAYRRIRQRIVDRHREWVIRSYALSFAAVTLRLEKVGFAALGTDFATAYVAVAWLAWIPNLVVAELIVRRSRRRPASTLPAA